MTKIRQPHEAAMRYRDLCSTLVIVSAAAVFGMFATAACAGESLVLPDAVLNQDQQTAQQASSPQQTKPNITPGVETTRITEPLDEEGYVDFAAALNELGSSGVTPENNLAVEYMRIVGPRMIAPEFRHEFFQKLEMEELPDDGDYYRHEYNFVPHTFTDFPEDRAWNREQYPKLHEWLEDNERHIDRFVKAVQREKMFIPIIRRSTELPQLDPENIATFQALEFMRRDLASALRHRAMLDLGEGRTDRAIHGLLTLERAARHVARVHMGLQACFLGMRMQRKNLACWQELFESADLNKDQLADLFRQIEALPQVADFQACMDLDDRFYVLDVVQHFARDPNAIYEPTISEPTFGGPFHRLTRWDAILRDTNDDFDRLVAGMALSPAEREHDFDQLDEEKEEQAVLVFKLKNYPLRTFAWFLFSPRGFTTTTVSAMLRAIVSAGYTWPAYAADQSAAKLALLKTGSAVAAYKSEHGALPNDLEQLMPAYFESLPIDPFSGESLIYRRFEQGYLLYSVGANRKDDGGTDKPEDLDGTGGPMDYVFRIGK